MSFQSIFETTVTKLKPRAGSKLYDIATAAVVYSETGEVSFEYNGIDIVVAPTDTAADVVENYIKALSSKLTLSNIGINDFTKRHPGKTWPRGNDTPYTMSLGDNWALLNSDHIKNCSSGASDSNSRNLSEFFDALSKEH